mmetsp:Transcript_41890/g.110961  ORF Transcript_41890/g.110961 Transcript_41890/m.110961 type:complete len:188 (-) Transcript_41890:198-761(-)|eukprot:CAMPEP_0194486414 /NCGR_PEP_ID=MMETSP0253-20130528/7076_1 /TAXON_ID=2966 /ORGANISM="Noctiluca scintillans" /LENGTH=187 /DNA_ID=CAMNT_0039326503 /DNA_START=45 /DNA_END=608 /DNA_ORIENTATION=-
MATSGDVLVQACEVTNLTDALATAPHPFKGNCLFARRDIKEGEILLHSNLDELREHTHTTVADLEAYLLTLPNLQSRQDVLIHTVPAKDGTMFQPKSSDIHPLFNHARPGSCRHYNEYYTAPEWDTVALRDIPMGEEVCIDYDHSSGYEARSDEPHVQEYLELLDRYEVEKRPSKLTLPPAKFVISS